MDKTLLLVDGKNSQGALEPYVFKTPNLLDLAFIVSWHLHYEKSAFLVASIGILTDKFKEKLIKVGLCRIVKTLLLVDGKNRQRALEPCNFKPL